MYATRLKAVLVLLGLGVLVLAGSLFNLQVIQGSRYREEAKNRLKRPPGFHPTIRGAIFDRNNLWLARDVGASNVAAYFPFVEMTDQFVAETARDWKVTPDEVRTRVERMWSELARLTGVPPDELARRRETVRQRVEVIRQSIAEYHGRRVRVREETYGERTSIAHPIVYDVDFKTVGAIASRPDDFPGLIIETTRKREYAQGAVAPHVIGRMGEVTAEELLHGGINKPFPPGDLRRYWPGDWIGRGGVEGAGEATLRGARGLFQRGIEGNFLEDIEAVPGRDVRLTLDIALQTDVEELLDRQPTGGRRPAAAVVIDVRTGEVLVLATAPRFDSRTFSTDFASLVRNPARPLVNRAVYGVYPLGSVFKAVTAIAALMEGAINPQTAFSCEGVLDPANPNRFRCHVMLSRGYGHGPMQLRAGIQKSCDIYFYHVGEALGRQDNRRIDPVLARDRLQAWAGRLGFGRPTGIGLPGEPSGCIDVRDVRNMAIGQGELMVTPLQTAQLYGLVATDGRMPPLRLFRDRPPAQAVRPALSLDPRLMATLRDALAAVVNEPGGTGYGTSNLPDIRIAGKTGTAQAGKGGDHAWFAGYAPAENPRVAFAVIVEHGGHGGEVAGPIAREIVRACQAHGYLDDRSQTVAAPEAAPANGNDKPANGKTPNGKPAKGKTNGHAHPPPPPPPPDKPAIVPVG